MAGALIITAEMAPPDHQWFDQLRRAHYPADRNILSAHLTMFHALPPSAEDEARRTLLRLTCESPPKAWIGGLMDLGGGVAFRIISVDLDRIRNELAQDFRGLLTSQDGAGWRPHITVQNKVPPGKARALKTKLDRDFRQRPLGITGLALHRYLGGPWEQLGTFRFRGN